MFKYAGKQFTTIYTKILNKAFETGQKIDAIGEGILTPIPKPNKPAGPIENLRPIILLNGIRKILSTVTLKRIEHNIDQFTGE